MLLKQTLSLAQAEDRNDLLLIPRFVDMMRSIQMSNVPETVCDLITHFSATINKGMQNSPSRYNWRLGYAS